MWIDEHSCFQFSLISAAGLLSVRVQVVKKKTEIKMYDLFDHLALPGRRGEKLRGIAIRDEDDVRSHCDVRYI